jgi:hypothetical protein
MERRTTVKVGDLVEVVRSEKGAGRLVIEGLRARIEEIFPDTRGRTDGEYTTVRIRSVGKVKFSHNAAMLVWRSQLKLISPLDQLAAIGDADESE